MSRTRSNQIIAGTCGYRVTSRTRVNGVVAIVGHHGVVARQRDDATGFGSIEHHIVARARDDVLDAGERVHATVSIQGRASGHGFTANGGRGCTLVDVDITRLGSVVDAVLTITAIQRVIAGAAKDCIGACSSTDTIVTRTAIKITSCIPADDRIAEIGTDHAFNIHKAINIADRRCKRGHCRRQIE